MKTILFASVIAAMILPFSMMDFADAAPNDKASDKAKNKDKSDKGKKSDKANKVKYAAQDIQDAMQKANSYMSITDNIVTFDKKSAKQTMSMHEIKIMKDFVKMQNDYVQKVKDNPNKKHKFDSEIKDKFSEFKKQVKANKNKIKGVEYFSQWILPEVFAWTSVCGGSWDEPHDEYSKKTIGTYSSETSAATAALNLGYHQVSVYASNPLAYFETVDMGKFTTEYGCNNGVFRDQIVVTQSGSNYDNRKQIKEPNPEFLSYSAPVWWWTWYTYDWHDGLGQTVITNW